MACSLCITNEKLTAVCGTGSSKRVVVKSFGAEALSEGALINGVITDERLLSLALSALKEKLPKNALQNVKIALRTSQIYAKRMAVPAMPQRKMLDWITGEFSDLASSEELLYDYAVLERDKDTGGQAALICAAQKSLIDSLVKYFTAEGVTISSIDTTLSAEIKLMRLLPHTRTGTYILLLMDGDGMDAALYVNGSFRYSNSIRLFSPRGTPESATEISRQVSSIIQFNTSERSGQRITNVYIAGIKPGEEKLIESLKNTYDLDAGLLEDESGCIVSPPDKKLPLGDFALAVGNLMDM